VGDTIIEVTNYTNFLSSRTEYEKPPPYFYDWWSICSQVYTM